MKLTRCLLGIVIALLALNAPGVPEGEDPGGPAATPAGRSPTMLEAKTLFQTNTDYDPRLAVAVDGVIVHLHGAGSRRLTRALDSWRKMGFSVGRMFFADSDATNEYWTGKWDGTPRPGEVERDARGEVVMCAGIRPYMLPTEGWTRYLQEMAVQSLDAGAEAVFPEEPLAHAYSGYEQGFREIWEQRYKRPWQPESASPEARFLTARLKNQLYLELERQLGRTVKEHAAALGREVPFIFPVHSLYSNVAAQLVAPLGTSLSIEQIDGYIGQVWTGPVRWALANYDSPDKSFFASAYVLYDYFVELVRGSSRKLWLLTDPVEDDPNHPWSAFEQWYRHCVAAGLLFPQVDAFEVMPWPDRIFLPGYASGGGTPGPERFRVIILSAVQIQQEVPAGGRWRHPDGAHPTEGVGVAMADTLLWHRHAPPMLQGVYSLFLPLVMEGVPVSACLLERVGEPGSLDHFKVVILSYEGLKPAGPEVHAALARWVRDGGSLVILGEPEALSDEFFWWTRLGLRDPLLHLLAELGVAAETGFDRSVGRGHVYRRPGSTRRLADPQTARSEYLPLVDKALRAAGVDGGLNRPGYFCMERGDFVIASATRRPLRLAGPLIDLFDPEPPVRDAVELAPGDSGVYRDVSRVLASHAGAAARPRVLHTTHRLVEEQSDGDVTTVTVRGPAGTPAVVRIHTAGRQVLSATAHADGPSHLEVAWKADGPTIRVSFPNVPEGATLTIRWGR